jgi:hypothetical protein
VAPRTIVLSPLLGATLTLTASGGPVTWSITESAGLIGELSVAPSSGRLLAGQSATVTLGVSSAAAVLLPQAALGNAAAVCVGCQLTVNPGGIKVLVVIDVGVTPKSPPPSSPPPG